jgi:long-chain acyl-CoA synthetase
MPKPMMMRKVAPAVEAKGPETPSLSAIYEYGPATELVLPAPAAAADAATAPTPTPATPTPSTRRVAKTCFDIFDAAVAARPSAPIWFSRALPGSPLVPTTHSQAAEQASSLAACLASLGLRRGDRVGIMGSNSPEWMLAMQACNRRALVVVPVYDTLGDEAVRYTLAHSGARVVVASSDKLPALAKAIAGFESKADAPLLSDVIVWGGAAGGGGEAAAQDAEAKTDAAIEALKKSPLGGALKTLEWSAALERGRAASPRALREADPPLPEDVSTIMFTSGTTGQPKGVVFTHAALVAAVAALDGTTAATDGRGFDVGGRYFSFLTVAHVFGRCAEEFCLARGVQIYYARDMRAFNAEIREARPTLVCGVPRILERISQGIDDGLAKATPAQKLAFKAAVAAKRAVQRLAPAAAARMAGKSLPVVDSVVLAPARKALGGSVRAIVSGAAPLPGHVFTQLQSVFGAPVVEAYGLTETAAASFCALPWRADQAGRVGLPCPGVQVRLESVPEMSYEAATDGLEGRALPRGEVLIKSPALFREYYKNDQATREALTKDGFFRTGDIGELDPRSGLKIIDRKKNMFKLSQGECR